MAKSRVPIWGSSLAGEGKSASKGHGGSRGRCAPGIWPNWKTPPVRMLVGHSSGMACMSAGSELSAVRQQDGRPSAQQPGDDDLVALVLDDDLMLVPPNLACTA